MEMYKQCFYCGKIIQKETDICDGNDFSDPNTVGKIACEHCFVTTVFSRRLENASRAAKEVLSRPPQNPLL